MEEEKCPVCLDTINEEEGKYFTCHNCSSLVCQNCANNLKICPCCRDNQEIPKLYLIEKFKKIIKTKPDIINNIIGCILCRAGCYNEASKYFEQSKLSLAKDNLDLINGVNIDYDRFDTEGFWYTDLYSLNIDFHFILNKVDFSKHLNILAILYFKLKKLDNFINVTTLIDVEEDVKILDKLVIYYKKINDFEKSIEYAFKALEKGSYYTAGFLAQCYLRGFILEKNIDKAEELFILGMEKSEKKIIKKNCCLYLVKIYIEIRKEPLTALKWLEKAIGKGIDLNEDLLKLTEEFKTLIDY